jgi:hypothetical protein
MGESNRLAFQATLAQRGYSETIFRPDVERILSRICRVSGVADQPASLFMSADGSWWVGGEWKMVDQARINRYTRQGWHVGTYTSAVGLDQLVEDIEDHVNGLLRTHSALG